MSQAEFDKAAEEVKNLKQKPGDDELLKLYGLFKRLLLRKTKLCSYSSSFFFSFAEATIGDNNTDKPGMFDLKGKYKWEAWNENKGKSKEAAQQEYVALAQQLKSKLG